jgi:hypothetical protein
MRLNVNIEGPLRKRLADIAANANLAANGRKLVEEGIVRVAGFPDAKVDLLVDWSVNPFKNRSWQWANAAFNFVPGLIACHAQGGGDRPIAFAVRALRSWGKAIRGSLKKYEFARHDHATARQAENLLFLLAYMIENQINPEVWVELAAAIQKQATLLEREDFYSRHTNHGIEQSRVLAMIADFFPGHPESQAHMRLAIERLTAELTAAFTKEGVHVENSPAYHSYVALSFIKIVDYFQPEKLGALAGLIDALMPKAIRFLTHIVRPDGHYPIIGDTQAVKVPNHFKRYSKTRESGRLRYALSDGAAGVPSPETVVLFPEAGYFIARDAWYPKGEGAQAFHLILRSGFRSAYHRHDDDLSLVLYCGEDWLVDSGAYSYSERDPIRRYMRSKWAHNVPVLVKPKAKRWEWESPAITLPMRMLRTGDGIAAVRAISHSYPGHVAMRDLEVDACMREFWVSDALVPVEAEARKRHLSLWHIPADKDIRIDGQSVEVVSRSTGNRLLIDNMGPRAKSISLFDPGVEGLNGPVVSPVSNKIEPVQLLAFEYVSGHLHSMLRFRLTSMEEKPTA